MFPNEIYENIIRWITDLDTICNCRLVCYDWKELVNNSVTKITNEKRDKRIMKKAFLDCFSKLKHLEFYLHVRSDLDVLFLKNINILENISWLEDMVLKDKTIKIYNKNSIFWLKRGFYGKYEKYHGEFNEIDGQLMDVCRCETLISNKKPYHYFPIKNFIYISGLNDLTCFDYIPFVNIKSYSWKPIQANDRRKTNFPKEVEKMSESMTTFSNIYPEIKKYEIPLLEKDLPLIQKKFPNCQSFTLLKEDFLQNLSKNFKNSENEKTDLYKLPTGEEYIDKFLI